MMLSESITSKELYALTGYSKAAIIKFEQEGLISRTAKDTWPIDTVTKLIAHLRERRSVVSPERARFEQARAQREEMKARQLAGELCRVKDFDEAWTEVIGYVLAGFVSLPARMTRDVALRRDIERELDRFRTDMSDHFLRRAAELEGKGKGRAA
jgi:phage terminase Nu1 subunit (DNA packaging protein)